MLAAWNCRGLGSADSPKVPYVSSLVRSFGIDVMFLIETLVLINVAVDKLSSLAFDGFCGSDALGLSGGLVVFWFAPVSVVPISISPHVIFCKVVVPGQAIRYVVFVYGSPHVSLRSSVWDELLQILNLYPDVVLLGDFNHVEYLEDKLGGAPSIPGRYDFLEWKIASVLVDIPFTGSPFTWTNGQLGNPTFERLDKGYASCSWLESYPDAMIVHQPILFSDHAAIVLKETIPLFPRKTPYRIENWCLEIREISLLIKST